MARVTLKGMIAVALIFSAALGAMRAQPYDDGGLRNQLAGDDCACFLGIRPGATTRVQALALLRASPWVEAINTPDDETITWTWNGAQPPFLRADARFARMLVRDGVVHSIGIATSARMGDVKIDFGAPDVTYYFNWQMRDPAKNYFTYFEQHGIYFGAQFEAAVSAICPLSVADMWRLPVILALPATADPSDILPVVRGAFAALPEDCQ